MTAPVQTEMKSQDATAGNHASGAQEEGQSQKIAMTAPVQTTMQDSAGDSATGAYKCDTRSRPLTFQQLQVNTWAQSAAESSPWLVSFSLCSKSAASVRQHVVRRADLNTSGLL